MNKNVLHHMSRELRRQAEIRAAGYLAGCIQETLTGLEPHGLKNEPSPISGTLEVDRETGSRRLRISERNPDGLIITDVTLPAGSNYHDESHMEVARRYYGCGADVKEEFYPPQVDEAALGVIGLFHTMKLLDKVQEHPEDAYPVMHLTYWQT